MKINYDKSPNYKIFSFPSNFLLNLAKSSCAWSPIWKKNTNYVCLEGFFCCCKVHFNVMTIWPFVNKIFKSIHCVHISNNVIKIHSMYAKCLEKFPKHIWRPPYVHEYLSHKRGGILCLLLKSGREIITILGHEILSTLKE